MLNGADNCQHYLLKVHLYQLDYVQETVTRNEKTRFDEIHPWYKKLSIFFFLLLSQYLRVVAKNVSEQASLHLLSSLKQSYIKLFAKKGKEKETHTQTEKENAPMIYIKNTQMSTCLYPVISQIKPQY